MIRMNQRICVANETVQLVGNVAPANRTIDAFRNGCSVMEKTIVATTAMNCQKIVQCATARPTSSAPTTDAFQSELLIMFYCIIIGNSRILSNNDGNQMYISKN